ncbi:HAD family hydrolase [Patescibacteria group bacterium]|nr:HAD family hydrolase [Patescibacteria group bacterium]
MERLRKNELKLVIFDYDGVIVDSVEWNAKAFIESFGKLGHKIKEEDFIVGESLKTQFQHTTNKYRLDLNYQRFKSYFEKAVGKNRKFIKVNKGFPDLFKKLSKNYTLAIASNNFQEQIEKSLTKHRVLNCFDLIVGIDDKGKFQGLKKQDKLNLILKNFQISAVNTVVIDDIPKHIETAHQLEMKTIGYQYQANRHMEFPHYC